MERPNWAPAGIDMEKPSAARLYDYYLGGFHNFEADRQMARQVVEMWPEIPQLAQVNRAFLRRAVREFAASGIKQFLDLGSGIPTVANVHEVAHEIHPDAKVVYVDHDAVAAEHSRFILKDNPHTAMVQADLRDPNAVLSDPAVTQLLDFTQPVGVLMVAVLHFVSDEDDASGIVARYRDFVVSGSGLAISHAAENSTGKIAQLAQMYKNTPSPLYLRTHEEIVSFFNGWDLLDPGVVRFWRPDPEELTGEISPDSFPGFAGVALLP
ncbi:MAG: SAM-dependent methyltransferase [Actinomycetota bacterium]